MTLQEFISGMPKAENHIHQDGATSPESALYLAERHGMTLPFSTPEEAAQRFQYRNLGDFIRMIDATNAVIQDEEDIAYLVTGERCRHAKHSLSRSNAFLRLS